MMLTIALALILTSNSTPFAAATPKMEPVRYCRAMVIGVSRSGDVKICKTKAQWDDFDSCRGPTRFCTPELKAALAKTHATPFAMNEDSRIVCRIVSATGSRLRSGRACLPQREWQRVYDDTQTEMKNLQNTFSKQGPF